MPINAQYWIKHDYVEEVKQRQKDIKEAKNYATQDALFRGEKIKGCNYYKLVIREKPTSLPVVLRLLTGLGYTKEEARERIEHSKDRTAVSAREIKAASNKTDLLHKREQSESNPEPQEARKSRFYCFPRKNDCFILRDELLAELHTALQEYPFVALTGIGGIGKSETALAFCHNFAQHYDAGYYLLATTAKDLDFSLRALWIALNPDDNTPPPPDVIRRRILDIWNESDHNLILFDNANHIHEITSLLQEIHRGHVLLTTQDHRYNTVNEAQKWIHCIPVSAMQGERGIEFLLRRVGRLTKEQKLDNVSYKERSQAGILVEDVQGLTLSLEIAAASLAMGVPIDEYYRRYQESKAVYRILPTRGQQPHISIYDTVALAFDSVQKESLAAADLLCLVAVLAPAPVPERIIMEAAKLFGGNLQVAVNAGQWEENIIHVATGYGLLLYERNVNPERQTLQMHREAQRVLRDKMEQENTLVEWERRATRSVAKTLLAPEFTKWPDFNLILPHVFLCTEYIQMHDWIEDWDARLLHMTSRIFYSYSNYSTALQLCQKAMEIRERVLEPEHPDLASNLGDLAAIYSKLAKYNEALPLHERALAMCEKAQGPEHAETAICLNNMACTYVSLKRYEEALSLHERALAICQKVLGLEHPQTVESLVAIANYDRIQGKYEEALLAQRRFLAIREKVLHPEHRDIVYSLVNLANCHIHLGNYGDAQQLLERALAICEKVQGPEHADTAIILDRLAECYATLSDTKSARLLYKRALAIRQKVLGLEHPDTASTMSDLADCYRRLNRFGVALSLAQKALTIRKNVLMPTHVDITMSEFQLKMLHVFREAYQKQNAK
jgi:tetratricopeptide (TPR) repeat protein